jgi:molecular chaperone GrpE
MKTEVRKDELTEADGPEQMPGDRAAQDVETAAAEAPLSDEQLQQLKTQAAKADEYWNQLLRTAADLDNYKKRAAREKQEAIRFANESLLQKLIPVLDNFEMALSAASTTDGTSDSVQQGVSMIQQQLKQVLTEAGLEEIIATGQPFDPNCHEAVSQQESTDVPDGHVLQQLRKGYKLRDRLLRPATVIVAKAPASKAK